MAAELKVGDVVKYKRDFLRNTGQITGDVPFARGRIESITKLGETQIATIYWNDQTADIPPKVNVANLTHADDLETASY